MKTLSGIIAFLALAVLVAAGLPLRQTRNPGSVDD
jgi:uncharacterized protein YciW